MTRYWHGLPSSEIENNSSNLVQERRYPSESVRNNGLQESDNNTAEVDVGNDHQIERAEQLQHLQALGGCSCQRLIKYITIRSICYSVRTLAVRLSSLSQVLDRPHDRDNNGGTADQVDQSKDVFL